MKKQPEKTAQTKADLTAAFWKLYKEKPINKITVKDITDTAGYYRSTMYYYFEDVYAILEYIETSVIHDWENNLTTALQQYASLCLQNNIEIMLDLITPFYIKNGEYIAVLLSSSGDPFFATKFKSALRQKLFTTLEIPNNTPEAELLYEALSSGILALFVKWYNDKLPREHVMHVLQKILNKNLIGLIFSYSANPFIRQIAVDFEKGALV